MRFGRVFFPLPRAVIDKILYDLECPSPFVCRYQYNYTPLYDLGCSSPYLVSLSIPALHTFILYDLHVFQSQNPVVYNWLCSPTLLSLFESIFLYLYIYVICFAIN